MANEQKKLTTTTVCVVSRGGRKWAVPASSVDTQMGSEKETLHVNVVGIDGFLFVSICTYVYIYIYIVTQLSLEAFFVRGGEVKH